MHDPIGSFERIRDLYLTYLETAFRIRDEEVSRERRALLEGQLTSSGSADALATDPLVEPVPRYAPATDGKSRRVHLHDLVGDEHAHRLPGFTAAERKAFVDLALAGLFDASPAPEGTPSRRADYPLYEHQADMLARGVQSGRPGVVTSGTGSGKTEAFLLPVLARIAKEAASWPAPRPGYLDGRWWREGGGFRPHREGEHPGRPAAVRALVLYPMNALVEDQLTRVRRALDSPEARGVMDERFRGNRIFFGRYTSATPVTGHLDHPRPGPDEDERKERVVERLADALADAERTQTAARDHDAAAERAARERGLRPPDPTRYLFPSVDGAELLSRWDAQQTPPDLLVTNTSMLSAMLVREVDAPIFDQTRAWIEADPDAYFYLVLDELHLQRGSAGTEVAYLLRVLLDRLGLTQPEHRHKLRVLASSASLPVDQEPERSRSLQYLYDFFGTHGLHERDGAAPADAPEAWAGAVVGGRPLLPDPAETGTLDPTAFLGVLDAYEGTERADLDHPRHHEPAWRAAATGLGLGKDGDLADLASAVVRACGAQLVRACLDDGRPRATTTTALARTLFGSASPIARRAVRALLVARGLGDALPTWWPDRASAFARALADEPSFRVHLFFRAIEGLFAAPDEGSAVDPQFQSEGRTLGPLSVERGERFAERPSGARGNRVLELLYCECCGELYLGGRRNEVDGAVELLPYEPDVSNLPEAARQRLFEELSYDDYAVFWPSTRAPAERPSGEPEAGAWQRAALDPSSGVVRLSQSRTDGVVGKLFVRGPGHRDRRHKRANDDPGTAVPFACPYCGTNYGFRKPEMRLSPLRSFRAGFAKTTQLLATELFDVLRLGAGDPKLISFSDSRQEAARAALDVEAGHHADLRRDLLVAALREAARSDAALDPDEVEAQIQEAIGIRDFERASKLEAALKAAQEADADDAIPLDRVVESNDRKDFQSAAGGTRRPLRPFVAGFVRLGLHPADDAGVAPVTYRHGDERRERHWAELFAVDDDGRPDWRDDPAHAAEVDQARVALVDQVQRVLTDALFSRNYFALEETGLGYPCLLDVPPAERSEADAFLRVLTDAYRLRDDPWAKPGDERDKPWAVADDVPKKNRLRRFAERVGPDPYATLDRVLRRLRASGHSDGFVATAQLGVRLVGPADPFWRCGHCGRVHLHRGVGTCTRCFQPLPDAPSGEAGALRRRHYLAKRVERGAPPFRLRCEELTGQTFDPADRQRRFRGVVLDAATSGAGLPAAVGGPLRRAASEVDLLTVTTTMEVGVDVGSLQATVQANMPPQRFNYQQRVGRAGRRRQAFSVVLTVCRNRSHDLHYFRHPEAITGDQPPPPFLSKSLSEPALRFARKAWLARAFDHVRDACARTGEPFPYDELRPPDVHGEFVPTADFFAGPVWSDRLRHALEATRPYADRLLGVLAESSPLGPLDLGVDDLLADVASVDPNAKGRLEATAEGLGQTLAEAGLLPMLGMPTRVRDLYYDAEPKGNRFRPRAEWKTIDRDLDVAIYEFAPGAVLVNDKRQLECIGFTGPLPEKPKKDASGRWTYEPRADAFGAPFWLVECERCGGWNRLDRPPDLAAPDPCKNCGAMLDPTAAAEHRVPNGFRTDLRPKPFDPGLRSPRRSGFGLVAESDPAPFGDGPGNLACAFSPRARTYRVNGADGDGYRTVTVRDWKYPRRPLPSQRPVLLDQVVAGDDLDELRDRFDLDGPQSDGLHLAAPKTTDALYLAPRAVHPHLDLLPRRDERRTVAVRAAALSAAFLLTYKAAEALDVDPDELEVVEPRVVRLGDGTTPVPALQITDQLVNGAGYCRQLHEPDADGVTLAVRLARSVVGDPSQSPLADLLVPGHPEACDQACYRCLQRYGNQPYHGLLDWRLGLAYLQALLDPNYDCALGGIGSDPATVDWPDLARRYATDLVRFDGVGEVREVDGLVSFRVQPRGRWAVVVHPLWNVRGDLLPPRVEEALDEIELGDEQGRAVCVDTFDLARSALAVRGRLLS